VPEEKLKKELNKQHFEHGLNKKKTLKNLPE